MIGSALSFLFSASAAAGLVSPGPVELFKSACIAGKVQLDQSLIKPIDFKHLPQGARAVVGRAIYRGPGVAPYPPEPLKADVPNPMYRIGDKDVFLIASTAEPVPGARFADSCVVVWKGDGFDQARAVILPNTPDLGTETAHNLGIGYVSANDGQWVLTAALIDRWTALKASPASTEPSPPVSLPGAKN